LFEVLLDTHIRVFIGLLGELYIKSHGIWIHYVYVFWKGMVLSESFCTVMRRIKALWSTTDRMYDGHIIL